MLSSELELCLNQAFRQARSQRHEYLTVEHLLLALLEILTQNPNGIRAQSPGLRGSYPGIGDAFQPTPPGLRPPAATPLGLMVSWVPAPG